MVVSRPSFLDVPKEKEKNGVIFYKPNEGEPKIRNFKGIGELQDEIENLIDQAKKLDRFRKKKNLSKKQDGVILDRIRTLLQRADKLKQLTQAKIYPENISKHKRLGIIFFLLKYFIFIFYFILFYFYFYKNICLFIYF